LDIVERVISVKRETIQCRQNTDILDIGTGSGCILLSIIKELKTSSGVGVSQHGYGSSH